MKDKDAWWVLMVISVAIAGLHAATLFSPSSWFVRVDSAEVIPVEKGMPTHMRLERRVMPGVLRLVHDGSPIRALVDSETSKVGDSSAEFCKFEYIAPMDINPPDVRIIPMARLVGKDCRLEKGHYVTRLYHVYEVFGQEKKFTVSLRYEVK